MAHAQNDSGPARAALQGICMTDFSAYEQLLLELVNRARMDPVGEAARLGIGLNDHLAAGTISSASKQPLAGNEFLVAAAEGHSQHMLATSQFNHAGIGDGTPTSRMQAAGYALAGSWMTGENIAWVGTTGTANQLQMTLEIHDNLMRSAGHRENIMTDGFRELGTGVLSGHFTSAGTTYNAVMATENFGLSGASVFVTGVALNDANNDNFYGLGEGRSGIAVSVTTAGATANGTSKPAGGFNVATASGSHLVTFSGGDLAGDVSVTVSAAAKNVKVDLSGTNKILSSADTTLGAGAADLVLLGATKINGTGNDGDNVIEGNRVGNVLSGGIGNDTLIGGLGHDVLSGGSGNDVFDFNRVAESRAGAGIRDVISDFVIGQDKIDLFNIDANTLAAGNQDFKFIAGALFHHIAGELRFVQSAGHTYAAADVNGDAIADFQLDLTGTLTLTKSDFVL